MATKRSNTAVAIESQVSEEQIIETVAPVETAPAPVQEEYNLEQLMSELKTKSATIRFLSSKGWANGKIAKFMGIRYQHVRNVLITPLKKVQEPQIATAE